MECEKVNNKILVECIEAHVVSGGLVLEHPVGSFDTLLPVLRVLGFLGLIHESQSIEWFLVVFVNNIDKNWY